MPSKGKPTFQDAPREPSPLRHGLYDVADVEAALGRSRRSSATAEDPFGEEEEWVESKRRRLLDLVTAGEPGRWRTLAAPTPDAIERVRGLDARAPHLRALTDAFVVRLRAAQTIGLPIRLPPTLLLGPPGVGKSGSVSV